MRKLEFSFDTGSALFTWLRNLGVLRRDQPTLRHRILFLMAVTWLPVLISASWHGIALGGDVRVPFLFDLIQYARFFVALPIAIWAEAYISPKFNGVLNRFVNAQIVTDDQIQRLESAIRRANFLKDSLCAELLILVLAYLYIPLGLQRSLSPGITTWDQLGTLSGSVVMIWYHWVSMPIFIFIWLRWIWRVLIWGYLLFLISRLKLRLIATHPDHAGGLAFISVGQRRFAVLVLAFSALLSASIAEEILFGGASLHTFELELTAFFVVCVLVVMGPLIVFTPHMIQAKLRDWGTYGVLAANYTRKFDDKWIQGNNPSKEELLGSQDIQALADLQNGYQGISQMRVLLPDRQTIVVLLIAYVLPIAPLLATVIPLRKILSEIFKLLMK